MERAKIRLDPLIEVKVNGIGADSSQLEVQRSDILGAGHEAGHRIDNVTDSDEAIRFVRTRGTGGEMNIIRIKANAKMLHAMQELGPDQSPKSISSV